MNKQLFLALMIITSALHAETFQDRIHAVENGLIKFQKGRVAFLNKGHKELSRGDLIEAKVDEDQNLVSFKTLKMKSLQSSKNFILQETVPPARFEPSILSSMSEVQQIFDRSNPYYKRVSECSDRAHVWAFDEFKRSGIKSMKAFVFFTASYINSVRFKWWFHVAPMYKVNTPEGIQDIVTDFRYTTRPMSVKEWTDQFVYTKRPCKVTTKFSEYDVNPQTENCYLMFESMHYKIPGEIHAQEVSGIYKTNTTDFEIRNARSWAFENK